MGRTPKGSLAPAQDKYDDAKLDEAGDAAQQLVVYKTEQEALVRATAAKIGYLLPADATDPDLIQRDISANMRRSVEACLEVGRGLTVLKAACGHGNFMARLEVLGIDVNVAGKFMHAVRKFSNSSSTMNLTRALGNQTKLFEMLVLDDEQIEELALTGQTGELHLDAVAGMSVKELRAAVRELKADKVATDEVLSKTRERLTELEVQVGKRKKTLAPPAPDQIAAEMVARAHESEATACAWIEGHLRQAIDDLLAHDEQHDSDHRSVLSGFITRIEDATDMLRMKYSLKRVTPDDPFAPLPDDFLEKSGIVMPKPINGHGNGHDQGDDK